MNSISAKMKNIRIAPRKARLVADLVRGMAVKNALAELSFSPKRGAMLIAKLLKSAVANAEHNFKTGPENLHIKEIRVDKGFVHKRYWPRARGSMAKIEKKTSHISIILAVKPEQKQAKFTVDYKKQKKETKNKNKKTRHNPKIKPEDKIPEPVKKEKVVEEKKKFFRRKSV